jgi:hypothetical protein
MRKEIARSVVRRVAHIIQGKTSADVDAALHWCAANAKVDHPNRDVLASYKRETERIAAIERRNAELEAALRRALPYVSTFAENAPAGDGGLEAAEDLQAVKAALGINQ